MLILAILGFGMLIGWLAQLVLGMGTRPNAQSLIAGIVGSFVGGLLGSVVPLRLSGLNDPPWHRPQAVMIAVMASTSAGPGRPHPGR